jgi:hypothetical protein
MGHTYIRRNETKRYFSINETKRYFIWNQNQKPKQNETKKKLTI